MASLHPELHSIHPHRALPFALANAVGRQGSEPDAPTHALLTRASLEPGEFERPDLAAVEVLGLWGSTILFAWHLSPARDFLIGEGTQLARVDFEIPAQCLSALTHKLVEMRAGVAHVNVPTGAHAQFRRAGDRGFSPSETTSVALHSGTAVELELGRLKFRIGNVPAAQGTPRAGLRSADRSTLGAFGLSFGAAAALIASFAFWMPALDATDTDDFERDRLVTMKQYLSAAAERSREEIAENAQSGLSDKQHGAPMEAARRPAGALGKALAQTTNRRAAVAGDSRFTELSHAQMAEAAGNFGMIALLGSLSSVSAGSSPFERSLALGHDSMDAGGGMWGDEPGESGGSGLGLVGPGNGGGGHGLGVGMDGIRTCGSGNCSPSGFAKSFGRQGNGHESTAPNVRQATASDVSGALPAEIVQRIVRQNYGRFRLCYETGLRGNPNLSGRVTARFVIGRDGSVSSVQNGGSDLPDPGVVSCVVQAFYGLSFPAPDNGIVRVNYPILFSVG